jgi:hypothetical protein
VKEDGSRSAVAGGADGPGLPGMGRDPDADRAGDEPVPLPGA